MTVDNMQSHRLSTQMCNKSEMFAVTFTWYRYHDHMLLAVCCSANMSVDLLITSCAGAATICPAPLLHLWAPKRLAPPIADRA